MLPGAAGHVVFQKGQRSGEARCARSRPSILTQFAYTRTPDSRMTRKACTLYNMIRMIICLELGDSLAPIGSSRIDDMRQVR